MTITIHEYKKICDSTKSKYGAKITIVDGIRFPSKLEAECYSVLKSLQEKEKILFFLTQVPFRLPNNKKHYLDFLVFLPNKVLFLESKGKDLPLGKFKREQVEFLYKIKIKLVEKAQEIYETVLH
jgi:hypothetical protein